MHFHGVAGHTAVRIGAGAHNLHQTKIVVADIRHPIDNTAFGKFSAKVLARRDRKTHSINNFSQQVLLVRCHVAGAFRRSLRYLMRS